MSTNSPVVSSERVVAPSWLKVKTQVRAGDKGLDLGGPTADKTTIPSWLKVKTQLRAGDKALDFGGAAVGSQSESLRDVTTRIRR